ncbi:hypothetical protein Q4R51_20370 [Morganella morganii]
MNKMMTIDAEMLSYDNDNIHSKMMLMNLKINQLMKMSEIRLYNSVDSIYLKSDSSLGDIHKNLMIGSVFKKYLRGSEYQHLMPRLAKGKPPAIGTLTALKMDESSTMFTYDAYGYVGICYYNEWESKKVSDWHVSPQGGYWKLGSDYYGNDISNIIHSGEYRFETNSFTSFPTTEPCVIKVHYHDDYRKYYRLTTTGTVYIKEWVSYNGTTWMSSPTVFTNNPSSEHLRIGDMLIDGNGELAIKVNSTTVKKL